MSVTNTASTPKDAGLEVSTSRQFESWMKDTGASFVISTYQAGAVLVIGPPTETGKLWLHMRAIERPMGIACSSERLIVASLNQVVTFINPREDADAATEPLFVPQLAHFTGDLDIHDLAIGADGQPVFVNTLFSCLATTSPTHSFRPIWTPPFISRLAAEDRCHLNGLAMRDGKPAYVTAVAQTDIVDGWRDRRRDGGLVMDVETNEIVAAGLSMPHSPRLYRDQLYVLNAGTGEFGTIDLASGRFEPIAFCPGYARGLSFLGDYAIVGLSELRDTKTFHNLELSERLDKQGVAARCGVQVIDLRTGDVVHWLTAKGIIQELFDVAVLPNARKPSLIGFKSDEIRRVISIED
ncbi:MAG: TIGR03032 family protein [Pseudomonadota bacterium]